MSIKTTDNYIAEGGPAFPLTGATISDGLAGMTMRDYFAGQALSWTGVLAIHEVVKGSKMPRTAMNEIAEDAYALADAMLAARKERS